MLIRDGLSVDVDESVAQEELSVGLRAVGRDARDVDAVADGAETQAEQLATRDADLDELKRGRALANGCIME